MEHTHTDDMLIKLIGNEVCGCALDLPQAFSLSDEFLFELYSKAKAHDVVHIVGSALINNGLVNGRSAENAYREQIYYKAFKYENLEFVLEKVCGILENAKTPYMPLKGAVMSDLYSQPWMRTGCDIDILVHEENVENAAKAITEALGYKYASKGKHDIQILSTENIYVELHFSLLEEEASPSMAKVLGKAWEHAKPVEKGSYKYELDDAMFYFYHIAHMAKHFLGGGCGIRPFLDLWLMESNKNYCTPETKALLKKGRLIEFDETAKKLSKVWFSGEEHDEITAIMQDFIINGGSFGSAETRMLSEQHHKGGRIKYVLSRIFVPYDDLKGQYPIIKKYKFLTPICEICRLFSLAFGKKKRFRKKYIGNIRNASDEVINDINLLFERVGLS